MANLQLTLFVMFQAAPVPGVLLLKYPSILLRGWWPSFSQCACKSGICLCCQGLIYELLALCLLNAVILKGLAFMT